jgi:two-component system nitrate/nitrite response regulator NarL
MAISGIGMIDVALVAPVRAYRDALAAAMAAEKEFNLVCLASSGAEALGGMSPISPSVALLDFGIHDLVPLLGALHRVSPTTQLIAFGVCETRSHSTAVVAAAEAGLAGLVDAEQPVGDIIRAVRLAAQGQSSCSPRIASLLLQALRRHPAPPSPPLPFVVSASGGAALTSRERLVAELITRGLSNREIASYLSIGESTVKSHVHSVLGKLGLSRRDQVLAAVGFPAAPQPRVDVSPPDGDGMEKRLPPTG